MNMVSMLTYSLITSLFPLLLGMLSIAGLVLQRLPGHTFNTLVRSLEQALPKNLASVVDVHNLLDNLITLSGPLALVALVGLLWTGSNLFTNMENAFSIIFRVPDRNFIPQRIMGIGMVLILSVALPLSLAASSLITAVSAGFASALPAPLGRVLSVAGPLALLGILWLLFLAIYMIVPNVKVPFRTAWRGALTAAVLFGLVQLLFPLYFEYFLRGNAKYGTLAASALVLITWLWLFALITVLGAQVNAVGLGIQPLEQSVPRTIARDYRQSPPEVARPA
jgi:membrane protein